MLARKNIIVSGRQNAGKTTLIRALAHEIPALERFATLEKEYELYLHHSQRHPRVVAMQAREGGTEYAPDGRQVGEITLAELVEDALRMNLQRIIVGEVRGSEVLPMFRAMSHGDGGSLCTVHARSARNAFETLVTLCLSGSSTMSDTFAYRLAASAIDFVVHIRLVDETSYEGGELHRFVSEIHEVTGVGESGRPATNQIFAPGTDGRAVPRTNPACLDDLRRAGLDVDRLAQKQGAWTRPMTTLFDPR
jgi:Flp pilus assembly CpaF family ATPase